MRASSSVSVGGVTARQSALGMKQSHKAFIFISGALEMKFWKRAKVHREWRARVILLRRKRVHFVENIDGLQHGGADNFQALRTELVDRVLGRVPEDIVIAVVEVDEVRAGDAVLHEGNVIVVHPHRPCKEM